MSTLGKVLTVLTALMILVWVVMFAAVADLNRNYGEKVVKLNGDLERLEKQLASTQAEVAGLIPQITLQQVERDKQITVLRGSLSALEKLETESREAQVRVQLQIAKVQAEAAAAQAANELREKEKAEAQKDLADARTNVHTLMAANAKLLDSLTGLRNQFLATTAENRKLRDRLAKGTSAGTTPRVRAASLIRD